MKKGTPIFTSQVLKHVTEDKSNSCGIYERQIRKKSYKHHEVEKNKYNVVAHD